MRGKDVLGPVCQFLFGITPAYAGKRGEGRTNGRRSEDHPRVCGEKRPSSTRAGAKAGSPPRMRGKVEASCFVPKGQRITPAYAGKRRRSLSMWSVCRDHPRVCGEKPLLTSRSKTHPGSPPRMRGKERSPSPSSSSKGITPAYAGKSRVAGSGRPGAGDHPRVCGEKRLFQRAGSGVSGSPPRMRGKD